MNEITFPFKRNGWLKKPSLSRACSLRPLVESMWIILHHVVYVGCLLQFLNLFWWTRLKSGRTAQTGIGWYTQKSARALTLAWMLLLGQSGASRLLPPPSCSKQSCWEPETSAPALPWSPPRKHQYHSDLLQTGVIHLFKEVTEQKGENRPADGKFLHILYNAAILAAASQPQWLFTLVLQY